MKLKKVKIFTLISIFILISILTTQNSILAASTKPLKNLNINAKAAVAIDAKTRVVLYEKNANDTIPMASTTKIITLLVALKYSNLDKVVEISSKSANIHGSVVGYKKGEKITMRELLYGLMMRSGNDAAIAIAEGTSGSVEEFVRLMNEYANEIGILNTHFESPHGLDSIYHYSTAYDLAIATAKAKENNTFNDIVSSLNVDAKAYNFTRSYHNINKILLLIPNANGVKTGTTGLAGKCLVTSVKVKGHDVISVVLNCNSRWEETQKIYKYVEEKYEYKTIFTKGQELETAVFKNGVVKLVSNEDVIVPYKVNSNYFVKILKPSKLYSNIVKGQSFGTLQISDGNTIIYSKNLTAGNSIKKDKLELPNLKSFLKYVF
jgi:serine-type D-Ala-D-Ala carboxypeptidase (penicillin-binding protein 5/6)